jgi:hypothetical protein
MQLDEQEMAVRTDWREVASCSSHNLFHLFPVVRRILLLLVLKIYVSTILLSDTLRHHASTGCKEVRHFFQFRTSMKRPVSLADQRRLFCQRLDALQPWC